MTMKDPVDFAFENLDKRNRHLAQQCTQCERIGWLGEDFTKDGMGCVCDVCFEKVELIPEGEEKKPVV